MQRERRHRLYFWMMGTCIVLIVLAWNVVRLWSVPLAVAMSIVAAIIPPAASIIANMGALDGTAGKSGDELQWEHEWHQDPPA